VDLWNYMKYVFLLSSPSSHTVGLVTFISMLVIGYLCIHYSGCLFGVIWCVYMHRGDDLGDERNLLPHIVESVWSHCKFLGRVMFVYELGANTCWYFVCLMIVVIGTLCLDIHCWECLSSSLFMQDIIKMHV